MFDGSTYDPGQDRDRLRRQLERVLLLMRDAQWRTLFEISAETGDPLQSVSARLRDLRKKKFGKHTVLRRRRGPEKRGLFEYSLLLNPAPGEETSTTSGIAA